MSKIEIYNKFGINGSIEIVDGTYPKVQIKGSINNGLTNTSISKTYSIDSISSTYNGWFHKSQTTNNYTHYNYSDNESMPDYGSCERYFNEHDFYSSFHNFEIHYDKNLSSKDSDHDGVQIYKFKDGKTIGISWVIDNSNSIIGFVEEGTNGEIQSSGLLGNTVKRLCERFKYYINFPNCVTIRIVWANPSSNDLPICAGETFFNKIKTIYLDGSKIDKTYDIVTNYNLTFNGNIYSIKHSPGIYSTEHYVTFEFESNDLDDALLMTPFFSISKSNITDLFFGHNLTGALKPCKWASGEWAPSISRIHYNMAVVPEKAFLHLSNCEILYLANVIYLSNQCFYECPTPVVILPKNPYNAEIPNKGFYNAGIKYLNIPNNYTRIGEDAFKYCADLKMLHLPENLVTIDNNAFEECTSLEQVKFTFKENSNVTIGSYAFKNAHIGGINFDEPWVDELRLGEGAFQGTHFYGPVVFTTSSTGFDIPSKCFQGAEGHMNYYGTLCWMINIPYDTHEIGSYAFEGCTNLKKLTFDNSAQLYVIDEHAFENCNMLTEIELPGGAYQLGIRSCAFNGCFNLTYISMPANIQLTGTGILSNCPHLKVIKIPFVIYDSNQVSTLEKLLCIPRSQSSELQVDTIKHLVITSNQPVNYLTTKTNNQGLLVDDIEVWKNIESLTLAYEGNSAVNISDLSVLFDKDNIQTKLRTIYVPASMLDKYRSAYPHEEYPNMYSFFVSYNDLDDHITTLKNN